MICIKCGAQLPDEANYCWKCGQKIESDTDVEDLQWEKCEIIYGWLDGFFRDELYLWAIATGPEGDYCICQTPVWKQKKSQYFPDENIASAYHTELVDRLIKDGWQPVGRNHLWWNDKFRRRVKKNS